MNMGLKSLPPHPHPFYSNSLSFPLSLTHTPTRTHTRAHRGIKSYLSSLLNWTSFLVSNLMKMRRIQALAAERTRRDLRRYSTESIQIMQNVRQMYSFPRVFNPPGFI